jgi:hypothetical protein
MDGPVKTVIISGLKLKVKDLTVTDNIIWSRNTGRVASGDMEGDIIAKKIKLNLTLAPLDDKEAVAFAAAIEPPFFPITFRNPKSGKTETLKFNVGTPTYPVYSYADGLPRYVGVAANFIEK